MAEALGIICRSADVVEVDMREGEFFARRRRQAAITASEVIVFAEGLPSPVRVAADSVRVLDACVGAKSLVEHERAFGSTDAAEGKGSISGCLRNLVELGLLVPVAKAEQELNSRSNDSLAVVVLTADRPRALTRCLAAVADQAERTDLDLKVLVVDGSSAPASKAANQMITGKLRDGIPGRVAYVGPAERERLREHLTREMASPVAQAILLSPTSIGGNRNVGLLLTAGKVALLIDDDVVCSPRVSADHTEGMALIGHRELTSVRFCVDRAQAVAVTVPADVSLFSAHSAVLGQTLATLSLRNEPLDVSKACGHVLSAISQDWVVRVTMSGKIGDSGAPTSEWVMFSEGLTAEAVKSDDEAYCLARRTREVVSVRKSLAIGHHPYCMALCTGVDNANFLPPFPPINRNEDGVFAEMLSALSSSRALFGQLPYGVLHDSHRGPQYEDSTARPGLRTELGHVLSLIIAQALLPVASGDCLRETTRLAEAFISAGGLSWSALADLVTSAVGLARVAQVRLIEQFLADPTRPTAWRRDLERARRDTICGLSQEDSFIPVEFRHLPRAAAWLQVAAHLRDFGEALKEWPLMWKASANWSFEPK